MNKINDAEYQRIKQMRNAAKVEGNKDLAFTLGLRMLRYSHDVNDIWHQLADSLERSIREELAS